MKRNSIAFEILKLILLTGIGLLFFMMGKQIFSDTYYSSALIGVSGGMIGLSLFQLVRILGIIRNPQKLKQEQVDLEDERNNLIINNSKSSAYNFETYIILGITAYAIYSNNIGFVASIGILWIFRVASFFYYLSKNNKEL